MPESYPQTITKVTGYSFAVDRDGLYRIAVAARCRSGKQSGERGGEDLRVEIDGIKLREIPPKDKPQYYDIPSAWNGTELKGLSKTVTIILRLNKGAHILVFVPRPRATIEREPLIELLNDRRHAAFDLNEKAEEGDRRSWHTIALVGLPLRSMSVEVTAEWRVRDSDDVKLIIDGEIKKNPFSILHRNWTWSGSILKKIFGKERQEKTFDEDLRSGDHYLEFWADRAPTLHRVALDLGESGGTRAPTADDPRWSGDFHDDSDQIILARAIFGEARDVRLSDKARIGVGWSIRNRVEDSRWAHDYHGVVTQAGQYSAFNLEDQKNRPMIEDPFRKNNLVDREAWFNCYKIAGQIIEGTVSDPTHGSDHYYDDSINPPYWATNDSFVIKIDALIFHKL